MTQLEKIRFRWFLIGFFFAQEGFNGEYPFYFIYNGNPLETMKFVKELIKEKNIKFQDVLRGFHKASKIECKYYDDLQRLTDEVIELISKNETKEEWRWQNYE